PSKRHPPRPTHQNMDSGCSRSARVWLDGRSCWSRRRRRCSIKSLNSPCSALPISALRLTMATNWTRTAAMAQLDMFGEIAAPQPSAAADPDRVRRKLDAMLAEARSGDVPLSRRRLMETVVPQMVRWLPEDEAKQFRLEFNAALERAA